jgi:NAD(P)-dependent dehydrogenase (short-subunit alcohol dehydrogenase family)
MRSHFETLDLANLRSVRAFAERVNREAKLDLLVNNAGVMSVPKRQLTADGFELQFGTNFLGPFALTALLMPALERAESPRVTTVSSGAANMGMKRINFDDLQWETTYAPWKALSVQAGGLDVFSGVGAAVRGRGNQAVE